MASINGAEIEVVQRKYDGKWMVWAKDQTNKRWILVDVIPSFKDETSSHIIGKNCKVSVFPLIRQ